MKERNKGKKYQGEIKHDLLFLQFECHCSPPPPSLEKEGGGVISFYMETIPL